MKLKITQTKSTIASLENHIANLKALGLHKIGQSVVRELRGESRRSCRQQQR